VRNPLDGSLSGDTSIGVPSVYANIGALKVRGIDVGFSYHRGPRDAFHYGLNFQGTYQIKNTTIIGNPTIGQTIIECAGKFGADCDTPTPKWKHVAALDFGWKNVDFSTRWRLIGGVNQDSSTAILRSHIGAVSYFDETVNINVSDKYTFTLGMLNVFDKKPPIVGDTSGATSVGGSTFPTVYDVLGRSFFARVTANF